MKKEMTPAEREQFRKAIVTGYIVVGAAVFSSAISKAVSGRRSNIVVENYLGVHNSEEAMSSQRQRILDEFWWTRNMDADQASKFLESNGGLLTGASFEKQINHPKTVAMLRRHFDNMAASIR